MVDPRDAQGDAEVLIPALLIAVCNGATVSLDWYHGWGSRPSGHGNRSRQFSAEPFRTRRRGATAFATYRLTPRAVIITHTETPRAVRGRGIASDLVAGALRIIRGDGRKVVAGCSFVSDYLRKHPEDADLIA